MLEISQLDVYYGVIQALNKVSLSIKQGEIVALIGANGAGKTTLLHTISGLLRAKQGQIDFLGKSITTLMPQQIVQCGIGHVLEGRHVFSDMSVLENLQLGAYLRRDKQAIVADMERIFESFPILKQRLKQPAQTLSGGEQQMLAMGRALMSKPKLLLLDEPSMGLAPLLVKEIFRIIESINQQGTTVLLVEQNAKMALKIAHKGYVLENGKIVLAGDGQTLLHNPQVVSAYLGG